jgi:hypothetical protein
MFGIQAQYFVYLNYYLFHFAIVYLVVRPLLVVYNAIVVLLTHQLPTSQQLNFHNMKLVLSLSYR